jgi:hypothetical protein
MAISRDQHESWLYGEIEERVMVMAIITMTVLSPIVMLWLTW